MEYITNLFEEKLKLKGNKKINMFHFWFWHAFSMGMKSKRY
ncbi:hypothetical protein [Clostridium sp.]|nr:hypothetical protein [Clostridium sp.]